MAGWNQLLIAVAIAVGAGVGLLLAYLFMRIRKRRRFSPKRAFTSLNMPEGESIPKWSDPLYEYAKQHQARLAELKAASIEHDTNQEPVKQQSGFVLLEEQFKAQKSEALEEVETNLRIATTPWTGKPLPFQTNVWETKSTDFDLSQDHFQDELIEAYADMSIANNIVWLSTELGRTNKDLESSYLRLCNMIAQRLQSVIPPLKEALSKRT